MYKKFLYICFCFILFIYFFVCFYILPTQIVEMHFFSTNFYILPCVILYCEKTPFQTTPYSKFSWKSIRSENNTLLLSFPDAHANPRNIWVGPPGGYRESLWNALLVWRRFQQSKVHLVHQVQMYFRWPVAVFTFYSRIRFFFNVFHITYNKSMFFFS